jgi:glutathione S-transferase
MPDIVVHHLENSRSQRVLWLLEELGLPYRVERYARDPKTKRAPAALRAIHPLGRSPVVTVDGLVLAESGAILEHLVDTYGGGRLKPTEPAQLVRYRFWMHYAEGSLMPPLLVGLIFARVRKAPWPVRPIARAIAAQVHKSYTGPELDNHLAFVEASLAKSAFFAGDELSAADVQMVFPVDGAMTHQDPARYPATAAWLAKMKARPAWTRALERGGPYDLRG